MDEAAAYFSRNQFTTFSNLYTVTMADEALANAGLHFDDLNKIRVLEPEIQNQTTELKEECKDFVDSK